MTTANTDLEYSKRMNDEEEECKRVLSVGMKVYRENYGSIQEGIITKIFPCNIDRLGALTEREGGAWMCYRAEFANSIVDQTYRWRWSNDRSWAAKELIREAKIQIDNLQKKIKSWESVIEENKDGK